MAMYDTLQIAIAENTKYSKSSYNLGTLDCTGFSTLYTSLFGEDVWEGNKAVDPDKSASKFSVSALVGYAFNGNTDNNLRVGLAASWRVFTEAGFSLDLRADVSAFTLLPGVYPAFDITAGAMCACPPIALGSTELVFSFGTTLGYGHINGEMGETYEPSISFYTVPEGGTNIFLMRFIVGAEFGLGDFSIGMDMFLEMPMYSVQDTDYWGYTYDSTDLGFNFIPSLTVKYRF